MLSGNTCRNKTYNAKETTDTLELLDKSFQRFCVVPNAWQGRAFEIMTEQELHEQVK